MTIYKLTQETWNNGQVGDFDLPKVVGYYSTEEKAITIRDAEIIGIKRDTVVSDYLTTDDYRIEPITVR